VQCGRGKTGASLELMDAGERKDTKRVARREKKRITDQDNSPRGDGKAKEKMGKVPFEIAVTTHVAPQNLGKERRVDLGWGSARGTLGKGNPSTG